MTVVLVGLVALGAGTDLEQGAAALSVFQIDQAVAYLEQARGEGPYRHADHARLYEQLGIAYAYLGQEDKVLAAFDMLLAIDPSYAVSYTLSPKVTFLFERAREQARRRTPPTIQVSWPYNLRVTDPIPIDVAVLADPKGFVKRAVLYSRRTGTPTFAATKVTLAPQGEASRLVLPPVVAEATQPEALELYLTVFDERGNEIVRVGVWHAQLVGRVSCRRFQGRIGGNICGD